MINNTSIAAISPTHPSAEAALNEPHESSFEMTNLFIVFITSFCRQATEFATSFTKSLANQA